MKNLIFGIFTLTFTSLSLAADSRSLVNFLDGLNRDMNRPLKNKCEGQDEELVKALTQCAIDLCGKPEELVSGMINEKNFSQYVDEEVKEHKTAVEEFAKKIFEKEKSRLKTLSDVFSERVKTPGFPNIEKWTDSEMSNMASHLWYGDVNLEVDKSKPLEERVNIDIEYPENASRTIKAAIEDYAKSRKERELAFPSSISNDVLTESEARDEYFRQVKTLLSMVDEARKKDPKFLYWMDDEFQRYRNKKPDELSHEDIKKDVYNLSWRIESTAKSANVPLPNPEIKDCREKCALGVKEAISQYDFKIMSEKMAKKTDEITEEVATSECLAELLDKGMKQSDKETFLANYPKMKKDFLNRSMANASPHSRKAFEKYLDEEVNLSFIQHTKEDLKKFLEELKKKSTEKPYDPEYAKQSDQSILAHMFNQRDYEDKADVNPSVTVCYEGGGAAVWDAFAPKEYIDDPKHDEDPTKDNIYVSLFSCTHQAHGKGVISHEMGHALSFAMEKKKLSESSEVEFLETRKCVTKSVNNAPESEGLLNRPGDSLYTEEDMADVLSYQATMDGPLFLCALLDTDFEATQYSDLSLQNQHPQDPHSSSLLRVIREAIYKKKRLTSSCKKMMDHHKDEFRFEPCL